MSNCHPDRKHYGRGLCEACHRQQFHQHRPDYNRDYNRDHYNPDRNRDNRLRSRFGLTTGQYVGIAIRQEGLCAICRRLPRGRWNRLDVDHDHTTGRVRGLLCHQCNQTLGAMDDQPERLEAAAQYLRKVAK